MMNDIYFFKFSIIEVIIILLIIITSISYLEILLLKKIGKIIDKWKKYYWDTN